MKYPMLDKFKFDSWYKTNHAITIDALESHLQKLQRQLDALYSVLSELDIDLKCYSQWHKAEAIKEVLNHIAYGESK